MSIALSIVLFAMAIFLCSVLFNGGPELELSGAIVMCVLTATCFYGALNAAGLFEPHQCGKSRASFIQGK